MSTIQKCLVVVLGAAASMPVAAAKIEFSCDGLSQTVKFVKDSGNQASTQAIQFNIGKAAAPGTIRVEKDAPGYCTAYFPGSETVVRAWGEFLPSGSFTDAGAWFTENKSPRFIESTVQISAKVIGNDKVVYSVSRTGNAEGNVTIVFSLEYR